jgi:voltage-gated potassium channel
MGNYMKNIRKRIYDIIEIGKRTDGWSTAFDYFIVVMILINLLVTLMLTFDELKPFNGILTTVESVTVIIFTVEYFLRLWTADFKYKGIGRGRAALRFAISFFGIVDLLTFLPFYLPIILPSGIVAFRILRVFRIFRLFRINAQYDAFNVITGVIKERFNQLISSFCLILILMLASSLAMYTCEHDAQPEVFSNAFSGIWWSVSTVLTVGYGDIYPITTMGKVLAIFISFFGVGAVAVPTGIISAGFVEQYTRIRHSNTELMERHFKHLIVELDSNNEWTGKRLGEINMLGIFKIMFVLRDGDFLVADDKMTLKPGDVCIVGSNEDNPDEEIDIREYRVMTGSSWVGEQVQELDISRLEHVAMIRRGDKLIDPVPSTVIRADDGVIIYKKQIFN